MSTLTCWDVDLILLFLLSVSISARQVSPCLHWPGPHLSWHSSPAGTQREGEPQLRLMGVPDCTETRSELSGYYLLSLLTFGSFSLTDRHLLSSFDQQNWAGSLKEVV